MALVFFDLETGGLDSSKHAVIQIAAVAMSDDLSEELGEFEAKVLFPESAADPEALKVNGYDSKVWEKWGKHPDVVAEDFGIFLKGHATRKCISKRGNEYFVAEGAAHNGCSFDWPFLKAWYGRRDTFLPMWPVVLDTLQLARWHYFGRDDSPENFKLETLAFFLGVWEEGVYHDALADVRATIAITKKLKGI